jgi:hypothetical protein
VCVRLRASVRPCARMCVEGINTFSVFECEIMSYFIRTRSWVMIDNMQNIQN